ncbi:MAG TPA: hypothetical protein DCM87_12325 [Planctomycetes bacterium]|nr:hypothetical protein [Planctomycetota bacterium]
MPPQNDSSEKILASARRVLAAEGAAVLGAAAHLGEPFCRLVGAILGLPPGRVAVTGVGKSGIIGMKIAATLASVGTPAFFLKPLDAVHGDLGMMARGDLLLALSHSGETAEILNVVFAAKNIGARVAAMTGQPESTLAREADLVLEVHTAGEACPLGLAPTTSTTVALAVGDALAMTLLEMRGFSREDYARYHPGGSLGRRLSLTVGEFMRTGALLPLVRDTDTLGQGLAAMTDKERLGVTLIAGADGRLAGILTDGDLRRILARERDLAGILDRPLADFMTRRPITIERDTPASEALRIMEVRGITSLAIMDEQGRPEGIVHLHDILGRSKFYV